MLNRNYHTLNLESVIAYLNDLHKPECVNIVDSREYLEDATPLMVVHFQVTQPAAVTAEAAERGFVVTHTPIEWGEFWLKREGDLEPYLYGEW